MVLQEMIEANGRIPRGKRVLTSLMQKGEKGLIAWKYAAWD